jgi:hypothetical protein
MTKHASPGREIDFLKAAEYWVVFVCRYSAVCTFNHAIYFFKETFHLLWAAIPLGGPSQ